MVSTVTTSASSPPNLGMFCVDFDVIESDEVKAALQQLAEQLTRAAG